MTRHTDDQIQQAAERFSSSPTHSTPTPLTPTTSKTCDAVATASQAVRADGARLREAVETARSHGRSWNQIAAALGVSRQAARQRFADKVRT